MSTPPKTPPFWSLKSCKIKEKKNPENEPKKNTKNYIKLLFLAILTPKMGHPGGGRASPFFHLFSSLGPIWAPLGSPPQNGAKGLIKGAQSSLWRILFEAIWCRFLMILGGFWNSFLMIFNAMCIVFYVAQNWKMPMADHGSHLEANMSWVLPKKRFLAICLYSFNTCFHSLWGTKLRRPRWRSKSVYALATYFLTTSSIYANRTCIWIPSTTCNGLLPIILTYANQSVMSHWMFVSVPGPCFSKLSIAADCINGQVQRTCCAQPIRSHGCPQFLQRLLPSGVAARSFFMM